MSNDLERAGFVRLVATRAYEDTVDGVLGLLQAPPRRRTDDLSRAATWCASLSGSEREIVRWIAAYAAHSSIFSVFTIIDGVAQADFDKVELAVVRGQTRVVINDGNVDLHDEFQALTTTERGEIVIAPSQS